VCLVACVRTRVHACAGYVCVCAETSEREKNREREREKERK
jgi:hypothetical protein